MPMGAIGRGAVVVGRLERHGTTGDSSRTAATPSRPDRGTEAPGRKTASRALQRSRTTIAPAIAQTARNARQSIR